MTPTPRSFSHIGLSVPDLDQAVQFYADILGFYVIMQPTEIVEDDSDIGQMCTDVFGAGWGRLRIAHLATADRIGIELFEFEDNHAPAELPPARHLSLRHPGPKSRRSTGQDYRGGGQATDARTGIFS